MANSFQYLVEEKEPMEIKLGEKSFVDKETMPLAATLVKPKCRKKEASL